MDPLFPPPSPHGVPMPHGARRSSEASAPSAPGALAPCGFGFGGGTLVPGLVGASAPVDYAALWSAAYAAGQKSRPGAGGGAQQERRSHGRSADAPTRPRGPSRGAKGQGASAPNAPERKPAKSGTSGPPSTNVPSGTAGPGKGPRAPTLAERGPKWSCFCGTADNYFFKSLDGTGCRGCGRDAPADFRRKAEAWHVAELGVPFAQGPLGPAQRPRGAPNPVRPSGLAASATGQNRSTEPSGPAPSAFLEASPKPFCPPPPAAETVPAPFWRHPAEHSPPSSPSEEERLKDLRVLWQQCRGKPSLVAEAEALASQIADLQAKVAAAKPVATRLQGALGRRERLAKDILSAADAVALATKALDEAKAAHAALLSSQADLFRDISALQRELAASTGPSGPDPTVSGPLGPLADMAAVCSDLSAIELQTLEANKEWVLHALRGITGNLVAGLRAQAPDSKRPASPTLAEASGLAAPAASPAEGSPQCMELSGSGDSPVRAPAAKFSKLAADPLAGDPCFPQHPAPSAASGALAPSQAPPTQATAATAVLPTPPTVLDDCGPESSLSFTANGGGSTDQGGHTTSDDEMVAAALAAQQQGA